MKKLILPIIVLSFILSAQAQAACTWREKAAYGSNVIRGGCNSNEVESDTKLCSGSQPAGDIHSGYVVSYPCCCDSTVLTSQTYVPEAKFKIPELQVAIPGLDKLTEPTNCNTDASGNKTNCEFNWIQIYILALYQYAFSVVGIIAAIILMVGGVIWLTSAGDAGRVGQAKKMIAGSITGIIILFSSFLILKTINPALTEFPGLKIGSVTRFEPDKDGLSSIPANATELAAVIGAQCGQDSIADIINKSKGKVTYSSTNRGTISNDTINNDCSGFASLVLQCAYNKKIDSSTSYIFKDQTVWNMDINSLQPGDLIGWAPSNNPNGYGHVLIYMGNGVFGDCHGGSSGRKTGNCVSNDISLDKVKSYAQSHSDGKLYFKRY